MTTSTPKLVEQKEKRKSINKIFSSERDLFVEKITNSLKKSPANTLKKDWLEFTDILNIEMFHKTFQ